MYIGETAFYTDTYKSNRPGHRTDEQVTVICIIMNHILTMVHILVSKELFIKIFSSENINFE